MGHFIKITIIMPLNLIPAILSPDLLHVLASAGHGDEIVLADAHFPTSSICLNGPKEIRADGITIPDLLEAILTILPLDTYESSAYLMEPVSKDKNLDLPVWEIYKKCLKKHENRTVEVKYVERFAFYEQAKKAYAVVHTGELSKYGNIILKKGLVEQ